MEAEHAEELVVELAVVGSVVVAVDAIVAVAIAVDGAEHVVVVADVGSVGGEDVGEAAETSLAAAAAGYAEVAVHPTAAAFAWLLRAADVALQLVVPPFVYVAPLDVAGVAKQPVVQHIYDVVLRPVELVVPPQK